MVLKRCSSRLIPGRREAGERSKVVNEMRLIEVAAVECNARPIDLTTPIRQSHGALRSLDPTVSFRRHPNLDLEAFDESLRTQSDGVGQRGNARRQWSAIECQ